MLTVFRPVDCSGRWEEDIADLVRHPQPPSIRYSKEPLKGRDDHIARMRVLDKDESRVEVDGYLRDLASGVAIVPLQVGPVDFSTAIATTCVVFIWTHFAQIVLSNVLLSLQRQLRCPGPSRHARRDANSRKGYVAWVLRPRSRVVMQIELQTKE